MVEGLKQVLLDLLNQCKSKVELAEMIKLANIKTIWKRKAYRMKLQNDIGIFVLTIFRMNYDDYFPYLEENMSLSNIGAMKKKNIINLLYGIINSVIQGEEKCIDIQIYDVKQCFVSVSISVYQYLHKHTNRDEKD